MFSKSALLGLVLLGSATATLDGEISNSFFSATFAGTANLVNIPCGGSGTMTVSLSVTSTLPADFTYTLRDVDEGELVLDPTLVGPIPVANGDTVPITFYCTSASAGCTLSYEPGDDAVDGERSTPANAEFEFDVKESTSGDDIAREFPVSCDRDFVVIDDPHFKTWEGKWYDYMGECDLVFVDAPNFEADLPLRINIRTKVRYEYSYIESAVLQIGEETFEVGSWGEYFLNGVEGAVLPNTISGYTIVKTKESEKQHKFEVHISETEIIELKTYKDWVSVLFHSPDHKRYKDAAGMMGHHNFNGKLIGRDGITEFRDMNAFGQEWQIREDEPMLFQTTRLPQAPQQCVLPSEKKTQRRLGETIAMEAAEKACEKAGWSKGTIQMCIHDVMASGDLEVAEAGAM